MKRINVPLLLIVVLFTLTSCGIREVSTRTRSVEYESPPVPRPTMAIDIFTEIARGTCFPISTDTVVTAYHVVSNADSISVMSYPAEVIYYDENKDIAVLKTIWEFPNYYTLSESTHASYIIGDGYAVGDSGLPLLNKFGDVSAMLIGQRKDGTFATVDIRYLKDLNKLIIEKNKPKESVSSAIEEQPEETPPIYTSPPARKPAPETKQPSESESSEATSSQESETARTANDDPRYTYRE